MPTLIRQRKSKPPPKRSSSAADPTVLVTGFGRFPGTDENPTEAAVKGLQGFRVAGARVQALILPSSYAAAARQLRGAVKRLNPCAVVCFGVGPQGPFLLERRARNRDDDHRKDVDGKCSRNSPIHKNGVAEVASTLPLDVIRARLAAAEIPAMASDEAGGYVDNRVFYEVVKCMPPDQGVAGLIRMPALSSKADLASKARHRMQAATAVRLIVGAAAERGVVFRTAAQAREAAVPVKRR